MDVSILHSPVVREREANTSEQVSVWSNSEAENLARNIASVRLCRVSCGGFTYNTRRIVALQNLHQDFLASLLKEKSLVLSMYGTLHRHARNGRSRSTKPHLWWLTPALSRWHRPYFKVMMRWIRPKEARQTLINTKSMSYFRFGEGRWGEGDCKSLPTPLPQLAEAARAQ